MDSEFYRIKRLPPYVFAEVNAMKAKARAAGEDITDLGMGNPNLMPPQHVMDKVTETMKDPKAHRYSVSKGIHGLRKAMADYYERRFNVSLDPNSEVIATLGSKEGLANLAQAITAPGDGFVRIALVENKQRIRQAIRNMKQFMKNSDQYLNQIKEKKRNKEI